MTSRMKLPVIFAVVVGIATLACALFVALPSAFGLPSPTIKPGKEATDTTSGDPVNSVLVVSSYEQKSDECLLIVMAWPRDPNETAKDVTGDDVAGHLAAVNFYGDDYMDSSKEKVIGNWRVFPDYTIHGDDTRHFDHFDNVIVTFKVDTAYAYHSVKVYYELQSSSNTPSYGKLTAYVNGNGEIHLLINKNNIQYDDGIVSLKGLGYFTVIASDKEDVDRNIGGNDSPVSPQTGNPLPYALVGAGLLVCSGLLVVSMSRKRA